MPGAELFEVLIDDETRSPRCALEHQYGAALLLTADRVAVNFVSTIDGIVSFGAARDDSRAVGGGVPADRLLMAMLRALAGVIVIGAGTLRATRNHQWTPQALAPDRVDDLAQLRAAAGLSVSPAPLLVVAGSADLPADADAVMQPAVPLHVLGPDGAAEHGPAWHHAGGAAVRPDAGAIVEAARTFAGGAPILCEGGPHLLGTLLAGAVPLDLFLTVAPQLAGRPGEGGERLSLVEGVVMAPFARAGRLRSVRRADDHLLVRYSVDAGGAAAR